MLLSRACTFAVCWTFSLFVLASDQPSVDELLRHSVEEGELGRHAEAVKLASTAIAQEPLLATAYYVRGRERFRGGQLVESVADFDRFIELRPDAAPRQWERGIACFYAKMYESGARQFESYQKYDGQDVENSVWRYLCLVPLVGVERARATMLPIENDRRIPMMQIYEMYRGTRSASEVLAAVRAGDPADEVLAGRLFYAHLYLGLWHEANGDPATARKYIELAADEKLRENRRINRYMWDVARIHARKLRGEL
jgi:lipoprotein NlpI